MTYISHLICCSMAVICTSSPAIRRSMMQLTDSSSNVKEQSWIWQNEGADYFYDKNDWVRVRVEGEEWHDISPAMPYDSEDVATLERQSPYSIKASMMQPGLGPVVWWSDVQ